MSQQSYRSIRQAVGVVGVVVFAVLLLPLCAAEKGEGDPYMRERERMVNRQVERRGVKAQAVLEAMRTVPRHEFVPPMHRDSSYADSPLPIGSDQTISQPYIVAAMTEAVGPEPDHVVLEVGTGSGYQAAVLAEIVRHVYTIEIVEDLAATAKQRLARLGYTNITVRAGDGYAGWPEHAPFDAIVVTAAPDHIPQPLMEQLKPGGRLIVPVGKQWRGQDLLLIEKERDGTIKKRNLMPVRFVPLTGGHEDG